jgi:hypothetical protein
LYSLFRAGQTNLFSETWPLYKTIMYQKSTKACTKGEV